MVCMVWLGSASAGQPAWQPALATLQSARCYLVHHQHGDSDQPQPNSLLSSQHQQLCNQQTGSKILYRVQCSNLVPFFKQIYVFLTINSFFSHLQWYCFQTLSNLAGLFSEKYKINHWIRNLKTALALPDPVTKTPPWLP